MIVIGLTGSIGMGKSCTADMFAKEGAGPVQSADDVVHVLYGANAPGAKAMADIAPEAIAADGSVDRRSLRKRILAEPDLLHRVEAAVHPLVRKERENFLAAAKAAGAAFAVLEIPLLFETGTECEVDTVVVVSAPEDVQRERVLSRSGMDEQLFRDLLAQQMPDSEKRARADHVIDTGRGMTAARSQVREILTALGIRRTAG